MSRSRTRSKAKKAAQISRPARTQIRGGSKRWLAPVLITGAFLPGIFLVPFWVPQKTPMDSQSWEFGFNNGVAQAAVGLLLLCLFAWQLLRGNSKAEPDPLAKTLIETPSAQSPRGLLAAMAILQVIAGAVLIAWYRYLPISHYGEMTYFIQRLEAAILGQKPYMDFSFDYGPVMLGLPVWIYHLFHAAVSVEAAYASALVIFYIIGLGLAAYVISQLNAGWKTPMMVLVGIQWINLTMGLQYTPLRFMLPVASIFAVRHLERALQGPWRIAALAAAGFILPILNFAISPEMGLATAVSLGACFAWYLLCGTRRLALLIFAVLAGLAAAAAVFPRPYLDSVFQFGQGGGNFPVFPTFYILALLMAAILVLPRMGVIAMRDKSPGAAFCAGLAVLCGLMLLPALGRCDPGHVWINSMGLFIVALGAATWLRPGWRNVAWGIYIIIFPVIGEVSFWNSYQSAMQSVGKVREYRAAHPYESDNFNGLAPGAPMPRVHYSKLLPDTGWVIELPQVPTGLPVGDQERLECHLVLTGRNVRDYHIAPYQDIFDAAQLPRKFADLDKMEYIFVPRDELDYLQTTPGELAKIQGEADAEMMSKLLLFPVSMAPVHPLFQSDYEIMRRIAAEYDVMTKYPAGALMKRKQ